MKDIIKRRIKFLKEQIQASLEQVTTQQPRDWNAGYIIQESKKIEKNTALLSEFEMILRESDEAGASQPVKLPDLDGQTFNELMYSYRTAPMTDQAWVLRAFEDVKRYIRNELV